MSREQLNEIFNTLTMTGLFVRVTGTSTFLFLKDTQFYYDVFRKSWFRYGVEQITIDDVFNELNENQKMVIVWNIGIFK